MTDKTEFRTQFGSNIFRFKYANGPGDTWSKLCERLVDDVCGTCQGTASPLMSKDDRDQLTQYMRTFKFVAGGRYLYYAGRPYKAYNNCFGGETKVLTDKGWRQINQLGVANVVSPIDGKFYQAEFKSHGKQKLNKITFATVLGHQRHTWTVRATRQHHWALIDGTDTYDLRVGDVVPANEYAIAFPSKPNRIGFAHGFVYGDGNANGQLRLCSNKDKKYLDELSEIGTVTYPPSAHGDPVIYFKQDVDWKQLPKNTEDPEYIAAFITGWLAADGSETKGNKLCCVNKEAVEWFREYAAYAGIVITGELRSQIRNVKLGGYEYKNHEIFIQNYQYGDEFSGFKVIRIEEDSEEEVFCPYEPIHNRIVITHGIDTYQCYLLRAEEDTREEWSAVTWRAMSCLMTGGGIGIDYSRLRPAGKALSRTGGTASGPIPLMYAINEIGRNVMQGGSRRSAIYASLNWKHEDIYTFLKAKNWDEQEVVEGWTNGAIKQKNFNFPAPLDMTNISVNYDDAALLPYSFTGRDNDKIFEHGLSKNPIFLENCRQALMTGEPGFSFNFGLKEKETLRNACSEVTSEDDSDVCNLGSINLGNISSLDEFKSVVSLASKFLVCGTLRADLPYDKVYAVREKNRRLGLGLMGIHEWLLQRGYKYEVTDELHKWLEVYRDVSELAANEHCDRFYISRPVAYRAIAPTGSIGILAGTTTGIEPLFAVAYKRRFLTEGTKWKYQFVVDGTAQGLIDQYGIKPESIDTALDLANDYERRIRFQADIQDYVDMSISSTINLPAWGSKGNNESVVNHFAQILSTYAPRLRGFTCYPDGSRGGQPLTSVPYEEALKHKDVIFDEEPVDICIYTGHGGTCGA
jgi:ribonucleoside-diphosphate reductase alpha chain